MMVSWRRRDPDSCRSDCRETKSGGGNNERYDVISGWNCLGGHRSTRHGSAGRRERTRALRMPNMLRIPHSREADYSAGSLKPDRCARPGAPETDPPASQPERSPLQSDRRRPAESFSRSVLLLPSGLRQEKPPHLRHSVTGVRGHPAGAGLAASVTLEPEPEPTRTGTPLPISHRTPSPCNSLGRAPSSVFRHRQSSWLLRSHATLSSSPSSRRARRAWAQASPTTDTVPTDLGAADMRPDDAFIPQVPAHMVWKTLRTSS